MTEKLTRLVGSSKPVMGTMYPDFGTAGGSATVPAATPVINTP